MGCTLIILPIFIAEISEKHNRGKLVTLNNVFICLGNVYGYGLDSVFQMKWFTLMCSAPALICVLLFATTVPESPIHLTMKNKRAQAQQAFMKFRNLTAEEAEQVVLQTAEMIDQMPTAKNMFALLKNRGFRRSMVISNAIFMFIHFSGIFAILEYLHIIFAISEVPVSKNLLSVVVSLVQTFSVLLGAFFVDKLGRKRLHLLSASVVSASLFTIGFYFKIKAFLTINISWLVVIAIILFIVGYGAGLGPFCFVVISEIFPQEIKIRAATIPLITTSLTSFVVLFGFPLVRDSIGIAWCFWIFGIATSLSMIFTHIYVIETKNKSFLEIQSLLEKKINYRKPNC